jgi:hypothetical protein
MRYSIAVQVVIELEPSKNMVKIDNCSQPISRMCKGIRKSCEIAIQSSFVSDFTFQLGARICYSMNGGQT